jgi:transcription elongation GreA/GreB family factor
MDKKKILKAVLAKLEEELRLQLRGQASAAEGARHAEARAETKWDTCGLEQSYLARGLAKQFEMLAGQVEALRSFVPPDCTGKAIGEGALVETEMDGETFLFFLLNCGGGTEVEVDGREITVITPESPVGAALMGRRPGETYSFRAGMTGKIRLVE